MANNSPDVDEKVRSAAQKLIVSVSRFVEDSYDVPEIREISNEMAQSESSLTQAESGLDRTTTAAKSIMESISEWQSSVEEIPRLRERIQEVIATLKGEADSSPNAPPAVLRSEVKEES